MPCQHIEQIKKEVENFSQEVGNYDSPIYQKLTSIVNAKDIKPKIKTIKGFINEYKPVAYYNAYDFSYISEDDLMIFLNKIGDFVKECTCYEDLEQEKSLQNESMKIKFEKEVVNLENQLKEEKNLVIQLQIEKGTKENEIRALKDELEKTRSLQNTLLHQLQNVIEEKASFQNTVIDQDKEISEQGTENGLCRKRLAFIYENKLNGELYLAKKELEKITQRLEGDDKDQIKELRRAYEKQFRAEKDGDKIKIYAAEDEVEKIKSEIKFQEDMREIYEKCEKVAKLRVELEQLKDKYEVVGEVPLSF